jgi:hypothetical protein
MTHITIEKAKLEKVFYALTAAKHGNLDNEWTEEVLAICKQALAAPTVQEPLGYLEIDDIESQREYPHNCRNVNLWHEGGEGMAAIYTTPPAAPKVVDCHATGVCVQSGLRAEQPAPVPPTNEQTTDKDRLDWLNNNFFNRENVDWLTGNVSKESLMWVFFAPTKVQGDIRRVIDSAIDRENGITKGGAA